MFRLVFGACLLMFVLISCGQVKGAVVLPPDNLPPAPQVPYFDGDDLVYRTVPYRRPPNYFYNPYYYRHRAPVPRYPYYYAPPRRPLPLPPPAPRRPEPRRPQFDFRFGF